MSVDDDYDAEKIVMSPVDDDAAADSEKVVVGKVVPLDDDADTGQNSEKIERNNNVMVTLEYIYMNSGADSGAADMSIEKTEFDNIIANDGLTLTKYYVLWVTLPVMADTFSDKDFSLLQKYVFQTDPSSIKNLSFEEALEHELVAICVWFLLKKECPRIIKEGLASALQLILFLAPEATDMPIAKGESVIHARRISVDQEEYIDNLVVDALCSDDMEIIRQVCDAIYPVFDLCRTNASTSIQSELVELALSFPDNRDTSGHAALALLNCINRFNSDSDNGFMREELFQAVRSDCEWLLNIMAGADEFLLAEAYDILVSITSGKYDEDLWEALLNRFVPAILSRVDGVEPRMDLYDLDLVRKAATIISNTINKTSSSDAIRFLAVDMDCLQFLVGFLGLPDGNGFTTRVCMEAVEKILEMDDDDSELAMIIGEDGYLLLNENTVYRVKAGWHLLHNNAPNSERVISKYAPAEWQPDKFADIELYLGEHDDDIVRSFGD